MIRTIRMTAFQADEVRGLLDVVEDERSAGNRDDTWGEVEGLSLLVHDPAEAADDLEWRADFLQEEADSPAQGASYARSLRSLADKVRAL